MFEMSRCVLGCSVSRSMNSSQARRRLCHIDVLLILIDSSWVLLLADHHASNDLNAGISTCASYPVVASSDVEVPGDPGE